MTGRSRGKGLAQAVPAVMVLVLAASVVLLLQANREGYFYYDSWSYLELSKTVFHDFYRFSAWRSYASTSPYSAAFPPLWPTLIALWNALFGSGIHAGVWLAGLAWAGLAVAAEWAGRRLFALPWLGLASAALTLFDIRLVNEVVAGKTIPLQLALMALALGLLRFDGVLTARRRGGWGWSWGSP